MLRRERPGKRSAHFIIKMLGGSVTGTRLRALCNIFQKRVSETISKGKLRYVYACIRSSTVSRRRMSRAVPSEPMSTSAGRRRML